MKKNYLFSILIAIFLLTLDASAQKSKSSSYGKVQEYTIEGLSIYPNPVSGERIFITTKGDAEKEVEIFDVLGKRVLQATLSGKELFIGNISPGVYIIKIKEAEAAATRKLIIR